MSGSFSEKTNPHFRFPFEAIYLPVELERRGKKNVQVNNDNDKVTFLDFEGTEIYFPVTNFNALGNQVVQKEKRDSFALSLMKVKMR